jgi:hypothetical protein
VLATRRLIAANVSARNRTVLPVAILFGLIIAGTCRTETLEKFSNISGFNLEARIDAAKTLELSAIRLRLPSRPTGAERMRQTMAVSGARLFWSVT